MRDGVKITRINQSMECHGDQVKEVGETHEVSYVQGPRKIKVSRFKIVTFD